MIPAVPVRCDESQLSASAGWQRRSRGGQLFAVGAIQSLPLACTASKPSTCAACLDDQLQHCLPLDASAEAVWRQSLSLYSSIVLLVLILLVVYSEVLFSCHLHIRVCLEAAFGIPATEKRPPERPCGQPPGLLDRYSRNVDLVPVRLQRSPCT